MHVYRPADRIFFGKHRGHTLAEIYRFFPSYIAFLVKYIPDFLIEEKDFARLPLPTPFIGSVHLKSKGLLKVLNGNTIAQTYRYLREGNTLLPVRFTFGKETRDILARKRMGVYRAPKWARVPVIWVNLNERGLEEPEAGL